MDLRFTLFILIGFGSCHLLSQQEASDDLYKQALHFVTLNVQKNSHQHAIELFKEAARLGNTDAQFDLAFCYAHGIGIAHDIEQAVFWYCQAAEHGHIKAQYYLARCYHRGDGIAKDTLQAVAWYEKAAHKGHAKSQCALGECHENGDGVTQDFGKAVAWYFKAAQQKDADAQCNLGACYFWGRGIDKDFAQAIVWLDHSIENGSHDARVLRNYFCLREGVHQNWRQNNSCKKSGRSSLVRGAKFLKKLPRVL